MSKREREKEEPQHVQPVPEDMALPASSIMRIAKGKLPDGVMINKDAKLAFSKATSIFILYLSTIASDVSKEGKRSTVTAQDVLTALHDLEFHDFLPDVELCLAAYREAEKARSLEAQAKKSVAQAKKAEELPDDGAEEVEQAAGQGSA
mmetsp:Transcript_27084/g.56907  ORF Transcript_27084/g.56907 Transcript_27084/m.56907 type:complete len:149 (+) Transcript_27084:130-576(+)